MKKLFNVIPDIDSMTMDQLKGAVRNMEPLANALHLAFNEIIKEHTDAVYDTVLCLSVDEWDESFEEFYLPALNGGQVIINRNRLDSLLRWKLEFFAKYGDLCLESTADGSKVYFELAYQDRHSDGYRSWKRANLELERSNAAIYESMSKSKLF